MSITQLLDAIHAELLTHGVRGEVVLRVPPMTEMGEVALWCAEHHIRLDASPLYPPRRISLTPMWKGTAKPAAPTPDGVAEPAAPTEER